MPNSRHPTSVLSALQRRPITLVLALASWVPVYIFFQDYYLRTIPVNGPSMYPLLNRDYHHSTKKDRVLVWQHRPWHDLHRGTVVALYSPLNPERLVVKRVTAVEGDHVRAGPAYPFPEETVPKGHVWLEGDNKDPTKSEDSSTYGPVSKALIVGKVVAIVWPWKHATWLRWQDWKSRDDRQR